MNRRRWLEVFSATVLLLTWLWLFAGFTAHLEVQLSFWVAVFIPFVLSGSGALAAAVAGPPSKALLALNTVSFLVWAVYLAWALAGV